MKLAPSILAADLADLDGALRLCEEGGADLVHVDVMDGHFVPNLSFGIPVLAALSARSRLPMDVHLMVEDPARLLDAYLAAGARRVAVHWEATTHLDRVLGRIHEHGAAAGVAVNPTTPVELLIDALPVLDYVLLMSVNPGFSGQRFIPRALDKARRLRGLALERGLTVEIGMDGGIDHDNVRKVVESGVTVCVVGSAIFRQADPVAAMEGLRQAVALEEA
jgi:ribulose-phosphate 3-epimerase